MKVMVIGSSGMLGSEIMKLLGSTCIGYDLPDFDITNFDCVAAAVNAAKPDVILNTSGITDVDYCEKNPAAAEKVHHAGVNNLTATGIRIITVSTDQVFTRAAEKRYLLESDSTEPANIYAASKLRGEVAALECPGNTVVRTSWLFGKTGLLPWIIRKLLVDGVVTAVTDQTSCLTSVESLAEILAGMATDRDRTGLFHCVNKGAVTPYELACRVRNMIGTGTVKGTEWAQLALPAPRPVWSALGTERDIKLPPLEEVIELCLQRML
ncbi:MAG: NAD(P)-dependent oxidoreductase [Candidatus Sabulitectum sp.]|nr:NAD(P)-dependent oxidoreductase [Candidatus Sabulitectum sp.]